MSVRTGMRFSLAIGTAAVAFGLAAAPAGATGPIPLGMTQGAYAAIAEDGHVARLVDCIQASTAKAIRAGDAAERRSHETVAATLLQLLPEVAVLTGVAPKDALAIFGARMMPMAVLANPGISYILGDALIGPIEPQAWCADAARAPQRHIEALRASVE